MSLRLHRLKRFPMSLGKSGLCPPWGSAASQQWLYFIQKQRECRSQLLRKKKIHILPQVRYNNSIILFFKYKTLFQQVMENITISFIDVESQWTFSNAHANSFFIPVVFLFLCFSLLSLPQVTVTTELFPPDLVRILLEDEKLTEISNMYSETYLGSFP